MHGSTSNTLLFAGVGFYLLQSLQDLVGQANVDYREIQRNDRDDKHAANNPFHGDLRLDTEFWIS
jgi:hypothetical protein